jgi:hypothetical protein
MLKKVILAISCLFITAIGLSQELYIPRDVKQAYKNETRNKDGKPGANYWQNKATYHIKVQVAPPNPTITGKEEITYTNNSPDTLKVLNFKLYLNNHKAGAARLGQVSDDYLTSGTHIDTYSENGVQRAWKDNNDGTNKRIQLLKPLLPNGKVNLSIDWHFDMSKQSGREGAIDSTTFFLAYFYPRIAVYDDYEGWDRMTFTGSQEFYNDFNDYTVEVTVPKNYIVWATGDLLNPDEVLQPEYANRLKKSMTSDDVIQIATQDDLNKKQVTKQTETNTWKWKASNITDVAIAISDHYNWDAGSVVVDKKTNRRASVQAAYDEKSEDFKEMVTYGKHALGWFSSNYPGVPYPFSKSTIVRGFADMEYPMMVNDNSQKNPNFTRFVVEHEIAHTYFPFYMGTNETRFGFMDEGWATTLEYLIGIDDMGKAQATNFFKMFRVNRWINSKSMEGDVPIITPSNILSGPALGNNEYGKAALGYLAVKDLLGDKLFKKALQGYMARWNGKHPIPWDFFYSINDVSGKDLNWFWSSWYFSNNYIDIAVKDVETNSNGTTLKLENIGGMPAPFDVIMTLKDGTTKTVHKTPEVWKNTKETSLTLKGINAIESLKIDGGIFMDADTSNNVWSK